MRRGEVSSAAARPGPPSGRSPRRASEPLFGAGTARTFDCAFAAGPLTPGARAAILEAEEEARDLGGPEPRVHAALPAGYVIVVIPVLNPRDDAEQEAVHRLLGRRPYAPARDLWGDVRAVAELLRLRKGSPLAMAVPALQREGMSICLAPVPSCWDYAAIPF